MIDPSFQFVLRNGVSMPGIGFGGGQADPARTVDAVTTALRQGYRMLDTGAIYGDEPLVGEAIRKSGLPRSEIFIATKLWIHDFGQESAVRAFEVSARKLGVDHIDLYMLHWPIPANFNRTIAAYCGLEALLATGKVRAVGVSNFTAEHLDTLIAATSVMPAVNQIEVHPYLSQADLRARHRELGIVTQAWSPIGGIDVYLPKNPQTPRTVLQDPAILAIAAHYARTPAQIILRWHLQQGNSFIPKSSRPERIAENAGIFDFWLTGGNIARIAALDTGVRGGPHPDMLTLEAFPATVSA